MAYFEKSRLDLDNDSDALVQMVADTFERRSSDKDLDSMRKF